MKKNTHKGSAALWLIVFVFALLVAFVFVAFVATDGFSKSPFGEEVVSAPAAENANTNAVKNPSGANPRAVTRKSDSPELPPAIPTREINKRDAPMAENRNDTSDGDVLRGTSTQMKEGEQEENVPVRKVLAETNVFEKADAWVASAKNGEYSVSCEVTLLDQKNKGDHFTISVSETGIRITAFDAKGGADQVLNYLKRSDEEVMYMWQKEKIVASKTNAPEKIREALLSFSLINPEFSFKALTPEQKKAFAQKRSYDCRKMTSLEASIFDVPKSKIFTPMASSGA